MGWARKAGNWWEQYARARQKAVNVKGATVPGISTHARKKNKSGSNKAGALRRGNLEWGAASRKQEDRLRGINNRARDQHVAEGLADYEGQLMDDAMHADPDSYGYGEYRAEDGWEDHVPYGVALIRDGAPVDLPFDEWPVCECSECQTSTALARTMAELTVLQQRVNRARAWATADMDLPVCRRILRILRILDGDE